ncbi:MAG: DUF4956 domain-containing protein [Spirochaetaceae bacterium]|jgi:hypothetical protein|nr:DUF4956 domain-containing protein [Spirochaetaceae bacterium]
MQPFDFLTASVLEETIALGDILLCTAVSLGLGLCVSAIHRIKNKYNKNFIVTLALLPAIVQIVIMLVNRNIGAGIAVAGAFNLVRFRSIPGNSRDMCSVFFAMAIGFVTGMGYLFIGAALLLAVGAANVLLYSSRFGEEKPGRKILKIAIPESFDYEELFDGVFAEYTASAELDKVRTAEMGSLYELTYRIELLHSSAAKRFIDELRCRNGNLPISLGREYQAAEEL